MNSALLSMPFAGALLVALSGAPVYAQSQSAQSSSDMGKSVTITGCLQKGETADDFSVTADGKTYSLKSTSVKLSDHLNHQVTLTGTTGEGAPNKDAKPEGGTPAPAQLNVASLKMVSASCQ